MAVISSAAGPLGPGLPRRCGENRSRYLRFTKARWNAMIVEGWSTIAERASRQAGHHAARDLFAFVQSERPVRATSWRGSYTASSRQNAADRGVVTIEEPSDRVQGFAPTPAF